MRRKLFLITVGAFALVAAGLLVLKPLPGQHRLVLTAYFADARGLKTGAPVQIAGVQVGSVQSVRVRTDLRENPAEVMMLIQNPYEISIPNDAVVTLPSEGLLGQTYANIEIKDATGAPIRSGAVLKTRPIDMLTRQQLVDKVAEIANRASEKAAKPENKSSK